MPEKIRVGVIGCGHISADHIRAYTAIPGVEVAAISDLCADVMDRRAAEFGLVNARKYTSYREMLEKEKLDAVSVCTYNTQHAPNAICALENGADVLLEKPFASSLDDAAAIMRAEKRTGKFVSVGFQPRYNPDMIEIKRIVRSGILGDVYYIQTGGGRQNGLPTSESFVRRDTAGIGALGDIGCYSLDMVLNAVGYPKPLTVTGYASDFFGKRPDYQFSGSFEVEDFAAAFIRLEGGIVLDFRIAWAMQPDTPGDTIFFGKEGALRVPSTDCWNNGAGGDMTLYQRIDGKPHETKIPRRSKSAQNDKTESFAPKVEDFIRAVRSGGPAPVPTSQIIINQVIIDAILNSAKLGSEVRIEMPEI